MYITLQRFTIHAFTHSFTIQSPTSLIFKIEIAIAIYISHLLCTATQTAWKHWGFKHFLPQYSTRSFSFQLGDLSSSFWRHAYSPRIIYQYTQYTHYISMQYLSNASNFSTELHHIGVHARYQTFNAGTSPLSILQRIMSIRVSILQHQQSHSQHHAAVDGGDILNAADIISSRDINAVFKINMQTQQKDRFRVLAHQREPAKN